MKRFCFFFFLMLIMTGLMVARARAMEVAPVKCAPCHKSMKIFPESHKGYSLQATGKCFGCHKVNGKAKTLGEKIHETHLRKSPATMKDCFSCHKATKKGVVTFPGRPGMKASKEKMPGMYKYFESWMGSEHLDGSHRLKGVYCLDCHADYMDEYAVENTKPGCVECHGGDEEMANKTKATKFMQNPHKSHYMDLKCSACHCSHKPFEDFCAQCHPFNFKAPLPKEEARP